MNNWTSINEALPKTGIPLIVTVQGISPINLKKERKIKSYIFYIGKPTGDGYAFYDTTEGYLEPTKEEVLAWMEMPRIYEGE